jgi:hypothetical protein
MLPLQVHTRKDAKYSLKASYLEIYNEGVYDLVHFNPKAKSLPVKWDASYGFYVQGLKVVPCSQQRTMMEVRPACRKLAASCAGQTGHIQSQEGSSLVLESMQHWVGGCRAAWHC